MKKYIYSVLILCVCCIAANGQDSLKRTPEGAMYRIFTNKTGDRIKVTDVVTLQVIQKTDKDSVLSNTYTAGHPVQLQVQPSQSLTDLMEIFPMLTTGDSVLVKIPADSVFKGHEESRPPFFPVGSHIDFLIKVDKVQSLSEAMAERNANLEKLKARESVLAANYIADNKLVLKTTPSGLKYVITKTSLKPKPLKGDTVYVNYTGKLLNGQIFDSSIASVAAKAGLQQPGRTYEPIKFVLGHGEVVKGWDEGLLLLNEGAKVTFVIPSSLAYGDKGGGDVIPPYSTLVFDVELVKVKRIKHTLPAKKPLVHHHAVTKKKS